MAKRERSSDTGGRRQRAKAPAERPGQRQGHGAAPGRSARAPGSDVSPAAPPPSVEEVVPPAVAGAGGLENIPEELLPEEVRVEDELNHAGLDAALPGEDRAPAESAEEHVEPPQPLPEELRPER